MISFFYNLPPAGNRIPLTAISNSFGANKGIERSNQLSNFLDCTHILFLSSGRAALWLILKALSLLHPTRHKVIIPAYTCPAVASAVLKAGLTPVLCDINLDNFGYSQGDLVNLINEDTLAVITVHLFGFPANIEAVSELCRNNGAFFVEDAAQAFGNELPSTGKKLGLIGDVGFFSFGRGKPLSVLHGGLSVTSSESIHEQCLQIYSTLNNPKNVGTDLKYRASLCGYRLFSNPYLYWIPQSIPFLHLGETIFEPDFSVSKGSDIALSIIFTLLEGLENDKTNRMEKTRWYNKNLPKTTAVNRPTSMAYPLLRYPLITKDRTSRDILLKALTSIGISGALFYPCPLNELSGLKDVFQNNNVYRNAKSLSERLIALPVHESVTKRDMIKILRVIESIGS